MLSRVLLLVVLPATLALRVSRVPSPRMMERRQVIQTAAVTAGGLLVPEAALAKGKGPAVQGSNPAPPGYTIGVFSHGTPDYVAWRKVLDGFIDPATKQVALPPDMETIRIIYAKVAKGEKADEGVLALQVFADGGLPGVQKFYNQDPKKGGPGGDGQPWKGGREAGWLVPPWHSNYFQPRLFRGLKAGPPPPLKKGMGIIYGGHGLGKGQTFDTWAEGFTSAGADDFHDSCGIFASVAGPSLGKASSDVKNKVGIGAVHFTKSAKDTRKFLDNFGPVWEGSLKAGTSAGPLRLEVAEVMEDFIYPGDPNYKGKKA
jgi:hypothetical protein